MCACPRKTATLSAVDSSRSGSGKQDPLIDIEISEGGKYLNTLTLNTEDAKRLKALASSHAVKSGDVAQVVAYLIHSAVDGVRRPGSWERNWLLVAFGEFEDGQ